MVGDMDILFLTVVMFGGFSLLAGWGVARILQLGRGLESALVGILLITAVSTPFLLFGPRMFRLVVVVISVAGVSIFCYWGIRKLLGGLALKLPRLSCNTLGFFVSLVVASVVSWPYFSANYIFESHDLVYFGWLPAVWNPGFSMLMEANFAVPATFGASNMFGGALIATMAAFSPTIGLVEAIDYRAMFIWLAVFVVVLRLIRHWGTNLGVVVGMAAGGFFWFTSVAYELLISSFPYVVVMALLAVGAATRSTSPRVVVFLFLVLALAKAQIVFVSLLVLAFLLISRAVRLRLLELIFGVALFLGHLALWLAYPRSGYVGSYAFSILGVFPTEIAGGGVDLRNSGAGWIRSFGGFQSWTADPVSREILPAILSGGPLHLAVVGWVLFSVFGIYFFFFGMAPSKLFNENTDVGQKGLFIWFVVALLAVALVRNGNPPWITHQAHLYLIAPTALIILLAGKIAQTYGRLKSYAGRIGVTFLAFFSGFMGLADYSRFVEARESSTSAISLREVLQLTSDGELEKDLMNMDGVPYERRQVIASILRYQHPFEPNQPNSIVDRFLIR